VYDVSGGVLAGVSYQATRGINNPLPGTLIEQVFSNFALDRSPYDESGVKFDHVALS